MISSGASLLVLSGLFMFLMPVFMFFTQADIDQDFERWLFARPFHQIVMLNAFSLIGMLFLNAGVILL